MDLGKTLLGRFVENLFDSFFVLISGVMRFDPENRRLVLPGVPHLLDYAQVLI